MSDSRQLLPLQLEAEQILLSRLKTDPEVIGEIYTLYKDDVYAYVKFRVGRVEDAQEVVADTFMKVVKGISGLEWRHKFSLRAWIFRVARNTLIDFYRKRSEAQMLSYDGLFGLADPSALSEDLIIQQEDNAEILRLVRTLNPARQEVLILHYFGNLSLEEIARVLAMPRGTVDSHHRRGKEELRRTLELARSRD